MSDPWAWLTMPWAEYAKRAQRCLACGVPMLSNEAARGWYCSKGCRFTHGLTPSKRRLMRIKKQSVNE